MTLNYFLSAGLVFAIAFALSIVLTLMARVIAPRLGLIDKPGGRRLHHPPTARLGALPLWGAFTIAVAAAQLMPVLRQDPKEGIRLIGLLGGGTFIFLVGLLDDKFDLPPWAQFITQFIAAGIGIACLIFIERFNNPLSGEAVVLPFVIAFVLTLFWMVLMMNTVNFLDGIDGLAGGVIFIAALLLFIHAYRPDEYGQQQLSVSLLPLALMGTVLGFLLFNWHPASIFMGSGAVFLGFTIGALSIIGGAKMATILLVMGLPLLDVAWQAARRISEGKNPLVGDRGHVHFRLRDVNVSPRVIALGYYFFCAAFGLLALITTSRQFKLVALIVMISLVMLGFSFVARLSNPIDKKTIDTAQKARGE